MNLNGFVSNISVTIINPSDDNAVMTAPLDVTLDSSQQRNLIGATLAVGALFSECASNFRTITEAARPPLAPRYFRNVFRHAGVGVGDALITSNGDNVVTSLAVGASVSLEHRLVTPKDMPRPVEIRAHIAQAGGALPALGLSSAFSAADPAPPLWPSTCELSLTAFVVFGTPGYLGGIRLLRVDGAGNDANGAPRRARCNYDDEYVGKFEAELAFYNARADPARAVFYFGVSQFVPKANLSLTRAIEYQGSTPAWLAQPAEMFVRVFDAATGSELALGAAVAVHTGHGLTLRQQLAARL